jgi:hypothetical protein
VTEQATEMIVVELPPGLPVMTPKLARLLLEILQNAEGPPDGRPSQDEGRPVTILR